MADAAVKAILNLVSDKKKNEQSIETKEFYWDQFVKYLSSAILALVLLEISVDFFRGGGVSCFHPADTFSVLHPNLMSPEEVYGFGRDQAAFLNSYCVSSIPVTEYFPLYIIIHGLLLIVPHYIWTAVHKGNFDSFFSIAEKLERLRESETGEYSKENFDRVSKLEKEYGGRRSIFLTYIAKLILQLCVCVASVGFSGGYLTEFSFAFSCPRSLVDDIIPEGWPLNGTVSCVYVSLRILRLIRVGDFVLTALAGVLIIYGLLWCVVRHTEELGHVQVAKFVFQSYLKAEDFQFQPIIRFGKQKPLRRLQKNLEVKSTFKYIAWFCALKFVFSLKSIFFPAVQNDLDFFLLSLFRSDASYGRVFKNVQVKAELLRLLGRDHQLLHLYIVINNEYKRYQAATRNAQGQVQKNRRTRVTENNASEERERNEENLQTCWRYLCGRFREGPSTLGSSSKWMKARVIFLFSICCCCFRRKKKIKSVEVAEISSENDGVTHLDKLLVRDFRDLYQFMDDPEKATYDNFISYLGNVELLHQGEEAEMRQMIYSLVKLFGRPNTDVKEDSGKISNNLAIDISFGSLGNYLPLSRAFKSVCSVNFHPYYRNRANVVKEDEFYTNYQIITYPDNIYSSSQEDINVASKKLLEFLKSEVIRKRFLDMILVGPIEHEHHKVSVNILLRVIIRALGSDALLLAIRPLRIGSKKCFFHKFEPPNRLFKKYNIERKLKNPEIIYTYEGEEPCFKIKCAGVSCIFEFQAYHYIGGMDPQALQWIKADSQDDPSFSSPFLSSRTNTESDDGEDDELDGDNIFHEAQNQMMHHSVRNGGDEDLASSDTGTYPSIESYDH